MPVLVLLPLVVALYLYMERRAIPLLESRLKEKPVLPVVLKLVAKKSALDLLRDLSWVSMVVFGIAVAITFLAGMAVQVNAQNARATLARLGPLAADIREWKSKLWIITGALAAATAIFAWIRSRSSRRKMTDRLGKMYAAEVERLHEQQQQGEWEDLPPTQAMQKLVKVLNEHGNQLTPEERERGLKTFVQLDYERRMQLEWDELWNPKKEMEATPSSLTGRVVRLMGGKTPLKAWKTGQRWMSLAATGCWVLAAIGIGANAAVLGAIQERFVTAWDIVVAQNGEASGTVDRQQERSTASQDHPAPNNIEQINRLSRAFERAATQSQSLWEKPRQDLAYQQREVREFILGSAEQTQEAQNGPLASKISASEAVPESVREQVNIAETAAREIGPQTELGRLFRDHLLQQAALNPERWTMWQTRMESAGEFLQYSGLSNAGEAILGEAWGQALKTLEPSSYLAKELTKKVSKSVLEKAYQQKVALLEKALDGRMGFAEALSRVREAAWRDPVMPWRSVEEMQEWTASIPHEENLLEGLAKRPPYLQSHPVAGSSVAKAESVADEFAGTLSNWAGVTRHRNIAEMLVVYDDCLMPRGDAAPATLRTAFLQKSPAPLTLDEIKSSFSSARSFEKLRGFSRVGGIMIGRDARSKAPEEFTDLHWKQEDRGIRLLLVRADGPVVRSRLLDPQLVRSALIYAADGRPIAVTIMNDIQLERRRILLHPALDQTALGRDLILADGWIFHKKDRTLMDDVLERADQDVTLYEIAWRYRLVPFVKEALRAGLEQEARSMGEEHRNLSSGLTRSADWPDKSRSPLGAREKGFDPELVEWMQGCASESNVYEFGRCIQRDSEQAFPKDGRSGLEKAWKRWTVIPPKSQSMSHIREQPFDLGPDLSFLGERGREGPEEFQYLIQTTFGDGESFVDAEPWSHPVLRKEAAAALKEQMALPENQRIMREMMDFRDSQRVFRAALGGRLGEHFPTGRLADLMSAIPAGPSVKTADWEPLGEGPGAGSQAERSVISQIETLLAKTNLGDPALRAAMVRCRAALRSDPTGASTAGACNLSPFEGVAASDEVRTVVRQAIRLEYARQLRAALGALPILNPK